MQTWKDSLYKYFNASAKPAGSRLLGVETEHFIVERSGQEAVPYLGKNGIRQLLLRLMEHYENARIIPDDDLFGFTTPEFSITLEPASQLEISIIPLERIRDIGQIYRGFKKVLSEILSETGHEALTVGCQPVSDVNRIEMIPKNRYRLMDEHFKKTGTGGREMMRGSASLQVSIDYCSEKDFRDKIRAAFYYSPVLKLLCDNSSRFQDAPVNRYLKRTDIWRRVDPSRCGILGNVFSEDYGFQAYIDFLGNVRPIFLKKDGEVIPTGDLTIAELFAEKPFQEEDIAHILSMVFPDVRLKSFLEIRFADSVPYPYMLAYCALIKSLLYNETGLAFASEQIRTGSLSETDITDAEDSIMKNGWNAAIYGIPAKELAAQLLTLAEQNLPDEEAELISIFKTIVSCEGIKNVTDKDDAAIQKTLKRLELL